MGMAGVGENSPPTAIPRKHNSPIEIEFTETTADLENILVYPSKNYCSEIVFSRNFEPFYM